MRFFLISVALALGAAALAPREVPAQSSDALAHGRYLVTMAGQCGDCHGAKLQGDKLDFLNPKLPPIVQRAAPKIAGLPQLSRQAAIVFMRTGKLPNGKEARPPMPRFRFNATDATAIVTYLKSLP